MFRLFRLFRREPAGFLRFLRKKFGQDRKYKLVFRPESLISLAAEYEVVALKENPHYNALQGSVTGCIVALVYASEGRLINVLGFHDPFLNHMRDLRDQYCADLLRQGVEHSTLPIIRISSETE